MFRDDLPKRVRAVVIGGGIHGVAVLHDLLTRGWHDVILLEANCIGVGASARTQKFAPFIPGSSEAWSLAEVRILAREGLRLSSLFPELCYPASVKWRVDAPWKKWAGLACGAMLGSRKHCWPSNDGLVIQGYQYDDVGLVRHTAQSAEFLGGQIAEGCEVTHISMNDEGWRVHGLDGNKRPFAIGTLFVINCAGNAAASILETSGILPTYTPSYLHEVYLVVDAPEFENGLVWRSANRFLGMRFAIPWHNLLIVGPWRFETDTPQHPSIRNQITKGIDRLKRDLERLGIDQSNVFSGFLRQRAFVDPTGTSLLNWTPRSMIGEMLGKRGSLITLYGGSFLNFRHYAREIGDRIMLHFGERRPSQADTPDAWLSRTADPGSDGEILERFKPGGVAYDDIFKSAL